MQTIETKFSKIYLTGKSVKETCCVLDIPEWKGYALKQKLGLKTERWQKCDMPAKFQIKTKEILFGTLLGDASLSISGNCKYKKLQICHSPKQKEYLIWIKKELSDLKPSEIKVLSKKDKWGTLRFYTPPHPEFNEIYDLCYPNGEKQITKEWLDNLSPLSLALWYMDDGGTQKGAYGCKIATCAFNKKSMDNIILYLKKKWKIVCEVRRYESDHNYPRLYFDSKNSEKWKKLIEPFVIPSMMYKFDWKQ